MSNPINTLGRKPLSGAVIESSCEKNASGNETVHNTALRSENERLIAENKKLTELLRGKQSLMLAFEEQKKKSAEVSFVSEQREEEIALFKATELELREQLEKLTISVEMNGSLAAQCENQQVEIEKLLKDRVLLSEKNQALTCNLESNNQLLETHARQNKQLSEECKRLEAENGALLSEKEQLVVARKELVARSHELSAVKRENAEYSRILEAMRRNIESFKEQVVEVSAQAETYKSELEKSKKNEKDMVTELENTRLDHQRVIEKLSFDHANYVEKLMSLYAHQRLESERQFQRLMQTNGDDRESTKRALSDLATLRDRIERDYASPISGGAGGGASSATKAII